MNIYDLASRARFESGTGDLAPVVDAVIRATASVILAGYVPGDELDAWVDEAHRQALGADFERGDDEE